MDSVAQDLNQSMILNGSCVSEALAHEVRVGQRDRADVGQSVLRSYSGAKMRYV